MPVSRIFGEGVLDALRRVMDLGAARQGAHAKNLANSSTEGYEREKVEFGDEMNLCFLTSGLPMKTLFVSSSQTLWEANS